MGKGLHQVFQIVAKEILQVLPPLEESGSEVSHFIPIAINFSEVTNFSEDIKKPWIKESQKQIKNLTKNQTFIVEDQKKGELVTPCMDVQKENIQSD